MSVTRQIHKVAAAADQNPAVKKAFARISELIAQADQKVKNDEQKVRRKRDAAIFVLGGAFVVEVSKGNAAAIELAKMISTKMDRPADLIRLHAAVDANVIPETLRPVRPAPQPKISRPTQPVTKESAGMATVSGTFEKV